MCVRRPASPILVSSTSAHTRSIIMVPPSPAAAALLSLVTMTAPWMLPAGYSPSIACNCSVAAPAANARVTNCTRRRSDGLRECESECVDGYQPQQTATTSYLCNEFGQWTGGNLECSPPGGTRKSCPALSHCAGLSCLGSSSSFVPGCNLSAPGVVCEAECKPGFEMPDGSSREEWECSETGDWISNRALCQGILCTGPPEPNANSCEGRYGGLVSKCSAQCTHGESIEWFGSESWIPTVSLTVGDTTASYECSFDSNSTGDRGIWIPLGKRLRCRADTSIYIAALFGLTALVLMGSLIYLSKRRRTRRLKGAPDGRAMTLNSVTENLLGVSGESAAPENERDPEQAKIFSGFDTSGEAKLEEIEIVRYIAKGSSGIVYSAMWNGMKCAVKRFEPQCSNDDQKELLDAFHKEVFLVRLQL